MAAAVSRGQGFALIGTYIADGHEKTIKTFPLPEDAVPAWLVMAWRKERFDEQIALLGKLLQGSCS